MLFETQPRLVDIFLGGAWRAEAVRSRRQRRSLCRRSESRDPGLYAWAERSALKAGVVPHVPKFVFEPPSNAAQMEGG